MDPFKPVVDSDYMTTLLDEAAALAPGVDAMVVSDFITIDYGANKLLRRDATCTGMLSLATDLRARRILPAEEHREYQDILAAGGPGNCQKTFGLLLTRSLEARSACEVVTALCAAVDHGVFVPSTLAMWQDRVMETVNSDRVASWTQR